MFIVFLKNVDSPPIKYGRANDGCEMEDKYAKQLIAEGFAEEVRPDEPNKKEELSLFDDVARDSDKKETVKKMENRSCQKKVRKKIKS